MRQGPWALPPVLADKCWLTPRRRNAAKRVPPRFHCRQTMARSRRLTHWSRRCSIEGVSAESKVAPPPNEVAGELPDEASEADALGAARHLPDPCLGPNERLRRDAPFRCPRGGEAKAQEGPRRRAAYVRLRTRTSTTSSRNATNRARPYPTSSIARS